MNSLERWKNAITSSCKHFISPYKIIKIFSDFYCQILRRMENLNPLWLRDYSKNVSKAEIKEKDFSRKLADLLTGSTQSNCRLPCTTLKAETKLLQSVTFGPSVKNNWVEIVPLERIEVTQTKYMNSTLSQYLASLVRSLVLTLLFNLIKMSIS